MSTVKSNFTYRPFTLEGNFAFASGIQEMILQSQTGTVYILPAIPERWKDVSFRNLRAAGAFLFSANMKNSIFRSVTVTSGKGGELRLEGPFERPFKTEGIDYRKDGRVLIFSLKPGQEVTLTGK